MAESGDLCSLIKLELDQEQEVVKVGETEKKDVRKEEKVSETEEKDLQKEAKISRTEEKYTEKKARVSEMVEKHREKEAKVSESVEIDAKVSEMVEKHMNEDAKVSEMVEKHMNEDAKVSEMVEKHTKEDAKVSEMVEKYAKVSEMVEKHTKEDEKVSEMVEKYAKVSEMVEKHTKEDLNESEINEIHMEEEAKVSEMEEKHMEEEEKVSEMEENHVEEEAKVSEMDEKVSEAEKDENVSEIEEANTKKDATLRPTEEKISEAEVSKKKAKVSFKLGLDDGDILSSCSDLSFEVGTDNIDISAQSDSHSSSQAVTTRQVKKKRKRQSKGGIRHRTSSQRPRNSVQSQQFSNKAWLAHQKAMHLQEKDKAAAATRYSEEQHLVVFPAAPFNSTQYLLEERNKNSPPQNIDWLDSSASCSPKDQTPVPLSVSETSHEPVKFPKRNQEFADSLISVQAETLQNLPKEELVKNCIHLEEHVAALYKQVGEAEGELKQEQEEEEDVFLTEGEHIDRLLMFESVYNSEANSLSSNNEDFLDLSGVDEQPVCVEESSVFTDEKPVTPSVSNCSSSESSS